MWSRSARQRLESYWAYPDSASSSPAFSSDNLPSVGTTGAAQLDARLERLGRNAEYGFYGPDPGDSYLTVISGENQPLNAVFLVHSAYLRDLLMR